MTEQEQPQAKSTGDESEPAASSGLEQQAKPPMPEEAKRKSTDHGTGLFRQPLMKRTDFPYVVTLLFAFFAWAVTHAVDRLITLPLVKLTQTVEEQANGNHLTFEFENITSSVNFEDLIIRILGGKRENRFSKPEDTIIGNGWTGNAKLFKGGDNGIELKLPHFHPGWRLKLTTVMTGGGTPRVQLESASVPTILEPVSWRTWLVEWELFIIASFAVLALIFIVVWARKQ